MKTFCVQIEPEVFQHDLTVGIVCSDSLPFPSLELKGVLGL